MSGFENPQNVKVGDSVFVTDDNIAAEYRGTHGVIQQIDTTDNSLPLFVQFTSQDGRSRVYWIREGHYSKAGEPGRHLTLPANMSLEEAYVLIDQYEKDYAAIMEQRDTQERLRVEAADRLTEQQRRYSNDMGAIQTIMLDVKSDQEWCDDGYNRVVQRVNREMQGGWTFDLARRLVKKSVNVRGTTTVDVDVWVLDGDDENDPDFWHDEDGDEVSDTDEFMQDALKAEFERCNSAFDDVEVA